jgi:hypothetical protein
LRWWDLTDREVQIPPDLLAAIAADGGGRVVIVIGAGASYEAPTEIPLAGECSEIAHRRLVDNGVLAAGECSNPSDLSELAEVVHAKTGNQVALVEQLPRTDFRSKPPNLGTTIAAALLREGAVSAVLSLNFDLSLQLALGQLGVTNHVAVIRGPDDHGEIASVNFIYLHRSVEADPADWVLRSLDLEDSWKGEWEEMMTARVMASSVAVFAGLGSRAAVLVETTEKIRKASEGKVKTFQVDPSDYGDSDFAEALEIPEADYLQYGWGEFMEALSARLALVHIDELSKACVAMAGREKWQDSTPADLRDRLGGLGLVDLGRLRARWLLAEVSYLPRSSGEVQLIADLLLALGLIEETADCEAVFGPDGVVDFISDQELVGSLAIGSGRGEMRWGAFEAELHQKRVREGVAARKPNFALVSGVQGERPDPVPPENVVGSPATSESIVGEDEPLRLVSVDELRAKPALAKEMVA